MNKSDIINKIYSLNPKLTKPECYKIVHAIFDYMCENISKDIKIEIRGFGCFSLKTRKAGLVMNPRAGIAVERGARSCLYFRPGKELKQRVDKINL